MEKCSSFFFWEFKCSHQLVLINNVKSGSTLNCNNLWVRMIAWRLRDMKLRYLSNLQLMQIDTQMYESGCITTTSYNREISTDTISTILYWLSFYVVSTIFQIKLIAISHARQSVLLIILEYRREDNPPNAITITQIIQCIDRFTDLI